jgi:hypothetical protein
MLTKEEVREVKAGIKSVAVTTRGASLVPGKGRRR